MSVDRRALPSGAGHERDLVLLGVAVLAVSTSAPLIRYAAAPALAVAMWRNVLAVPVLAPGRRSGALGPTAANAG